MRTNSILVLLSLIMAAGLVAVLSVPAMGQSTWYPRADNYTTSGWIVADGFDVGDQDSEIAGNLSVTGVIDQVGSLSDLNTTEDGSIVDSLNELVADLAAAVADIASNESAISDVVADVAANSTKIDDAVADIAANSTRIDDVVIDIAANESAISDAVADIAANSTKIDNAVIDIAANSTRIDDVVIDIAANDTRLDAVEAYVPRLNVIAGGADGNHTLTGVAVGDALSGVLYVAKGAENLTAVSDILSEFVGVGKGITDTDVINNTAGTDTSGGYLIIAWTDKTA